MELEVIRHKTAELFFTGFFPDDVAASYSYQLQRMFESGAAVEGDYFIVTDGHIPYLQAEIYRKNTRRIWEKEPLLNPSCSGDKNKTINAVNLIFDFIETNKYFHSEKDRLEIALEPSKESKIREITEESALKYGYKKIKEIEKHILKLPEKNDFSVSEHISIIPFTELEVKERFKIVYKNEILSNMLNNTNPELFYQDYLDETYLSEHLWFAVRVNNASDGFFMPSFTSGLKNSLLVINYMADKSFAVRPEILKAGITMTLKTAAENGVPLIEFLVDSNDKDFLNLLKKAGSAFCGVVRSYFK